MSKVNGVYETGVVGEVQIEMVSSGHSFEKRAGSGDHFQVILSPRGNNKNAEGRLSRNGGRSGGDCGRDGEGRLCRDCRFCGCCQHNAKKKCFKHMHSKLTAILSASNLFAPTLTLQHLFFNKLGQE